MTLKGLSSKAGSIATIVTALGLLVVGVRAYDAKGQEIEDNALAIQSVEKRLLNHQVAIYQKDQTDLREMITVLDAKIRLGTISEDEIEDLALYEAEYEQLTQLISFTIGGE